jgi:hypothetical protein
VMVKYLVAAKDLLKVVEMVMYLEVAKDWY